MKEATARIKINQLLEAAGWRFFSSDGNPANIQLEPAVTSCIPGSQQFTINFANNNLLGSCNFLPTYKTSKARVCVTVGMKIDRMFFENFGDAVRDNKVIAEAVEAGEWDRVIDYVNREVFDKPEEYYSLDKLRQAADVDRWLTLREILEKVFGLIPRFKSKDELLEAEFAKFITDHVPHPVTAVPAIKHFFKAYISSVRVRDIIDQKTIIDLATDPVFSTQDLKAVPQKYRTLVPEYVRDYVPLKIFTREEP